jgi:uncharacterized protein (DUF924 family)
LADTHSTGSRLEPIWVTEILRFWFEDLGAVHWFSGSTAIDAQIRNRFLSLHERVVADDGLGATEQRSLLAAVIVLDQFSRHLFRGAPLAYAADAVARRLSRTAIVRGFDVGMKEQERLFLYMPFQHSEDPEDQALAVQLIACLGNEAWTRDAIAHKAIIDRFGRFPHRNAIFNRPSSADEIAILQKSEEWF